MAANGSLFLEQLYELEARGVRPVLCSTCLDYFGSTGEVRVGIAGSMTELLEAHNRAAKTIPL